MYVSKGTFMKKTQFIRFLLILLLFNGCQNSNSSDQPELGDVELVPTLISNAISNPWGMTFLNSEEFLVTEKSGRVYHFRNDELVNDNVQGAPASVDYGQGGLLDIAVHPNFESNGWVYFTYTTENSSRYNTRLSRLRWDGEKLSDEEILFTDLSNSTSTNHFGSRIAFDSENYVYFSIGDRGNRELYPQNLWTGAGKIHRLHDDGGIPTDNPYFDSNHLNTIYSTGHRNPQGLVFHAGLIQLWSHEHGPLGGDELNHIRIGRNYGWPVITYGRNYDGTLITDETERPGFEQPATYWVPSIAPCGMTVIENSNYSGWDGNILLGSLKFDYVVRVKMANGGYESQSIILENIGRVRNVQMGKNGYFYVATQDNGIFRIDTTE